MTTETFTHWHLRTDAQDILWLSLDTAGASTNVLSRAVRQELARLLAQIKARPPRGVIFLSGKSNGFIAGADISEFGQLNTAHDAEMLVQEGWDLMNALAALPCPTVALIDGHCLGAGLELALACRYRVVTEGAKLGLPEVLLGIVPGWGGMSRLPPLIGAPAALQLMLTGKNLDGKRAYRQGLATVCVPLRVAALAAQQLIVQGARAPGVLRLPFKARVFNRLTSGLLKSWVARQARQSTAQKVARTHYPAPYALIDIWAKEGGNALTQPAFLHQLLEAPAGQVPTAKNLQRVFHLQERLKSQGKDSEFRAQTVLVVGAGVMGGDIAILCAQRGLRVALQDTDEAKIASTLQRAQVFFEKRLRQPLLVRAAMDRLIPDPKGEAVPQADVVIEAVVENLAVKHSLLAGLEKRMKPTALLASNTSSLSLEEMATVLQNPARLIGIHFFNPVALMPLVEVVHHAHTATSQIQAGMAFVRQLDKLPLAVKSTPGFLVNAVLGPYMLAAMRLLDQGVAPAVVDKALKDFGMPMGPIELIDMVGLDVALAAGSRLSGEEKAAVPQCLQNAVNAGHLGRKSGRGFYAWQDGKAQIPPLASSAQTGEIGKLLVALLIKVTQQQVSAGVVADADMADAGLIFGAGFAPYTGGPLHYAATQKGHHAH